MSVIPEPLSVEAPSGMAPTSIGQGAAIHVPAGDAGARAAAQYLSDLALRTRGLHLRVQAGPADAAGVDFVRRTDPAIGAEGYAIEVGDGRVQITAASDAGLFYGAVTLWQLMTPGHGPVTLQPVRIEDRPRFAWRGLLLDSARHYQSPAFVERLIDWMALHKLNVLQWHLTDDQGWRLQIRRYPRLTALGGWRTEGGRRYGGFYTQGQVRRIVAFAKARHVTIVPEIEMPGHALAAILAYPQLGSAPPPSPLLRSDWGVFPYLFAPSDRTFTFLDNVLTEVMELFPSPYINVGGDEAIKDEWQASPAIQAQIKSLGLANEDALQGWFTDRIAAFLAAHGRRLMGWDDILAGGALPANAAVVSWHLEGAAHAAQQGHDAVISTDPVLYLDHRQADLPSEPPGRGIVVSLRDVYQYEPAPPGLPADQRSHIVGVQADIWTEHIRTEARVQAMAFPRAAALAELGWTDPGRKDWAGFAARLPDELARYAAVGLTPDDGALRVKLDAAPNPTGPGLAISLSNQLGFGQIRYTTDGGPPSPLSAHFNAPLLVTRATQIRAATFADGRQLAPALDQTLDPGGPQHRLSQQLAACSGKLVLNLEGSTAAQRQRPYLVDIMDPCWIYPQADFANVRTLAVAVTRLPFNFQLAHDAAKLVRPAPTLAGGELDVRADTCSGELVARFPLAKATRNPGVTVLTLPVAPRPGRHDLCLAFATGHVDPLWVIDRVELSSSLPPHTEAAR